MSYFLNSARMMRSILYPLTLRMIKQKIREPGKGIEGAKDYVPCRSVDGRGVIIVELSEILKILQKSKGTEV